MGEAERYPWEGVPAGVPCFHIYHDQLLTWSTEPLEVRAAYVREHKPPDEVETRLRLMRPVEGELPAEVVEALRAVGEAGPALCEAERVLVEAGLVRAEVGRARYEAWCAVDEARRVVDEAQRARDEAERALDEAERAYGEALRAHDEAVERNLAEVEALHEKECPGCPWDGKTIFPGRGDARQVDLPYKGKGSTT